MSFEISPDYKEVAERVRDLFAKHPDACLRGSYEIVTLASGDRIIYRAECYRTPDDPSPGVGTAWEDVPGKTPYTKGSELQNAETSAWGRAIIAVGASESKKIASADEVRLARERESAPASAPVASLERVDTIKADVLALEIQGWVKEQAFGWPWSVEECEFIEAKITSERIKLAVAAGMATGTSVAVEPVMGRVESLGVDPLGDLAAKECPECGLTGGQHKSDCGSPF